MPRTRPFLRQMRLRTSSQFARVYREGSRARGGNVAVAVAANGSETTRLGLSIGKRIWKGAVQRNRMRRIYREAFRLRYPDLPAGVDLVVMGSTPRARPTLDEAERELVHLARKAWRRYQEKVAAREAEAEAEADGAEA